MIADKTTIPLLTPALKERETAKIQLENGLEAYLISDPAAPKAGAVLTVEAGSWYDPEDHPGLAHFLEHMLFLGTEKYPTESDYDRFIRENDGLSNAYTADDYTLYLFSIAPKALPEALDRFSYFFKKPLFNPSGVSREIQAVNQEFAKNIKKDSIREYYVMKNLANPSHPFSRFNAGNAATLTNVEREVLQKWYESHYSADKMRLIVYAPLPIETLKNLVTEDFKDIPTHETALPYPTEPALEKNTAGKIVYVEPIKDIKLLKLTWEIPSSLAMDKNKPQEFISHLLGDEGPGSLLAHLKEEKLAQNLNTGVINLGKNHQIFTIAIELTEEGVQQRLKVIEKVFENIYTLQKQTLHPYLFDEFKKTKIYNYQYQPLPDAYDYLQSMGKEMVYEESIENFPESALIPQGFDPIASKEFLNVLTPEKAYVSVMAKLSDGTAFDSMEPWLKVPYKVVDIEPNQLESWANLPESPHFSLPQPNPYIPQELKLLTEDAASSEQAIPLPTPKKLVDSEQGILYYAPDNHFKVPRVFWSFNIKTPAIISGNPSKEVLAELFSYNLMEQLNPLNYAAKVAELNYAVSPSSNGITVTISGYSEKANKLFETIISKLKDSFPTLECFNLYKEDLIREYRNRAHEGPLKGSVEAFHSIIYESYSTSAQKAEALTQISYDDFKKFYADLFQQTFTEAMIFGNVTEQQAQTAWSKLENLLSSKPYPKNEQFADKVIILPDDQGPHAVQIDVKTPAHAAMLAIQFPDFSFKGRASQQILSQAMSTEFFATLRTKQQTGYLVTSNAEEYQKKLFSYFAVQSSTHDPRDLLARFELFIEGFLQELDDHLSEARFELIKSSLIESLMNTPQNLTEAGLLLNRLAFKNDADFNWMDKRIQGFKDLTYQEFAIFANQFLSKKNKRRLGILAKGETDDGFEYVTWLDSNEMKGRSNYKK